MSDVFVNPWEEASRYLPRRAEHTYDNILVGAAYQTMGVPMDAVTETKKLSGSIKMTVNLGGHLRETWD